jgi:hypothetical protein
MKAGYLLVFTILFLPSLSAQEQRKITQPYVAPTSRRVALVIGNSAYAIGPLKNPVNDARAMTAALRELSFDVIHKEDLNREDMRRAIREFGAKISKGAVGLFYYAGHGVQVRGENYLIPVDAAPESADEIDDDGVNAGYVLEKMESAGNGMNIVILDACRNNPFTRSFRSGSDGLASVEAPTGTLIAYATGPGKVAGDGGTSGNGIYTQELLKVLKMPGLSIEDMFKRVRNAVLQRTQGKQTPWESSSLTGDFYFKAPNTSASSEMMVKPSAPAPIEATSTPPSSTPARPSHRKTISVSASAASNGWIGSGVVEKGQRLRFSASGRVSLGRGISSQPAGLPEVSDPLKLMPDQPTGALIAVIGNDNDDFILIGINAEIVAKRDGLLFLGVNESNLEDNSGKYEVVIESDSLIGDAPTQLPLDSSSNSSRYDKMIYAPYFGLESRDYIGLVRYASKFAYLVENLSEIRDKHKVYVNAVSGNTLLEATIGGFPNAEAKGTILKKLREYRNVEIVETPENSDFIIHYAGEFIPAYEGQAKIAGYMIVTVRGGLSTNGSSLASVVWRDNESRDLDRGSGLIGVMTRHPADNMTRHLISALKKLRGEK